VRRVPYLTRNRLISVHAKRSFVTLLLRILVLNICNCQALTSTQALWLRIPVLHKKILYQTPGLSLFLMRGTSQYILAFSFSLEHSRY
jgi:hypothetical protein